MPLSRDLGTFNFLEPSGPIQACNGTDLPLPIPTLRNIPEEPRSHLQGGGSLKSRRLIDGPCGDSPLGSHDSSEQAVFLICLFSGTTLAIVHCSIVVTLILKDKTSCDLNSLSLM